MLECAASFMYLDLLGGKGEAEDRSMGLVVGDFDDTPVRLDDGAAQRQTEAEASMGVDGARALGDEEAVEDAGLVAIGDTRAVIGDLYDDG